LHQELKGVMSVLRGLITACDYEAGKKLVNEQTSYDDYQTFLRQVLEIARRHKIMNPATMRTEYGKLIYLLQDFVRLQADGHLDGVFVKNISLIAPIQTVYTKDILYDFFRSAFDGSGANNFYDVGSCIDGRLTSAWNWCSQLPNKPFYPIFKLTGFTGFDGEFK
jgi:hypothetical protein